MAKKDSSKSGANESSDSGARWVNHPGWEHAHAVDENGRWLCDSTTWVDEDLVGEADEGMAKHPLCLIKAGEG